MRRTKRGFLTPATVMTLAVAITVVVCGCNDDNNLAPAEAATVDFQNGTWSITTTSTVIGVGAECQGHEPLVLENQQVLCFATAADFQELQGFDTDTFACAFLDAGGDAFTMDCSASLPQGECMIDFAISGSGAMTTTSFTITMDFAVTASGPEEQCGMYREACTTRLELTGTWISAEGECPSLEHDRGGPLGELLGGAMRRTLAYE